MNTILTKKQQTAWLDNNWLHSSLQHAWSTRGNGSSRILDSRGNMIARAGGCGYDRYGAALGNAISELFPEELYKLGKRHCKGKRRNYKQPKNRRLYGLFYNSITDKVWVDGGCGSSQMVSILNAIGFGLDFVGESGGSNTGNQFHTLRPVNKNEKEWLK